LGCTVLEQASGFETDGGCVGMSSYVLDHGTPSGIPDASWILEVSNLRRDFRAAIGAAVA
jgi:predicted ATP-grasp superfamily ATP-dependent carboligase